MKKPITLNDLYQRWIQGEGAKCPKTFAEACLEDKKSLVEAIFDDINSALWENRSNCLMGDVYEDYFRIELMDDIEKIKEKYNV